MSSEPVPPIDQLPPETLTEIFLLVQLESPIELVSPKYPWTLALVCTKWRNITFTTPQLWSNFSIHLDRVREPRRVAKRQSFLVAILELCLERSRDHPLTIHIAAVGTETISFLPPFLESCVRHADQWEQVHLAFPLQRLVPFISDPEIKYPRLRTLSYSGVGAFVRLQSPPDIKLFQNAPLLTKLYLGEFPYPLSHLQFPWSQITDFTTHLNDAPSDIFIPLRAMRQLVSLRLSVLGGELSIAGKLVIFPHLQILSYWTYDINLLPFFDSILAPRLNEVELRAVDGIVTPSVQRFLQRSKCTITTIKLGSLESSTALALLSIFPDVTNVTFSSFDPDEILSRELTYDNAKPRWLCPRIRRIILENTSTQMALKEEFVSMIESRFCISDGEGSGRGCRLESVHVDTWSYTMAPDSGVLTPIQFIRDKISPQYLSSVTYEEKTYG